LTDDYQKCVNIAVVPLSMMKSSQLRCIIAVIGFDNRQREAMALSHCWLPTLTIRQPQSEPRSTFVNSLWYQDGIVSPNNPYLLVIHKIQQDTKS